MARSMRTVVAREASAAERFEVNPSDFAQAVLRVVLVSAVVAWTWSRSSGDFLHVLHHEHHFQFALGYFVLSLAILAWTWAVIRRGGENSPLLPASRVASIFADIGAASIYMALSGEDGVILYPVYLTSTIGYGYRFGIAYLYGALAVALTSFTLALHWNTFIASSDSLVLGLYLGMILVPLYAASLLKKHRAVLERIREVNAARSRFIANMSHELRTPLHAIISVSDILSESKAPDGDDADHEKLRTISESGQHLLNLVNKILDVAAADAGSLTTANLAVTRLDATLLAGLRICQPAAEAKGLQLSWHYDLALPASVRSAPDLVQEIVINTVGNAVKYTPSGHVRVDMLHRADGAQRWLDLEITDTGIGIPDRLLPNIFEPFILGDDGAARRYSGTGLGLTLTKKFVETLGGTIEIDSIEGVGTRCAVSLPLEPCPPPTPPAPVKPMQCVLVSTQSADPDVFEMFARHGWELRVVADAAALAGRLRLAPVVLIDSTPGSAVEQVLRACQSVRPRGFLALWGEEPAALPFDNRVRARVPRGDEQALGALRELAEEVLANDEAFATAGREDRDVAPRRVLVADDNATNLKSAELALQSEGHHVALVDNGEAALAALESGDFDVAFVDLHMPGMSGVEVAQMYQYLFAEPRTPVVILTADVTAAAREAAVDAGAAAVLLKPLRAAELRKAVFDYGRRDSRAHEHADDTGVVSAPAAGMPRSVEEPDTALDESVLREFLDLGVPHDEIEEMIDHFREDSQDLVRSFAVALRDDDVFAARDVLHALKGVSATLGATGVVARIEALRARIVHDVAVVGASDVDQLAALCVAATEQAHAALGARMRRPPEFARA